MLALPYLTEVTYSFVKCFMNCCNLEIFRLRECTMCNIVNELDHENRHNNNTTLRLLDNTKSSGSVTCLIRLIDMFIIYFS